MLQNRIYRGETTHKGSVYPGEHDAIVDQALFHQAQKTLAENRTDRVSRHGHDPSPLTGLLFDAEGVRLTPSCALKKGVRYRYYVSRHLITGPKSDARGMRLPAPGIEALVRSRIGSLLGDPGELSSIVATSADPAALLSSAMSKATSWSSLSPADLALALNSFVTRISVYFDRVEITIQPDQLAAWIQGAPAERAEHQLTTVISAPVRMRQRGQEMRLVFGTKNDMPPGHVALVRLLARAHDIKHRLLHDRLTIDEIAKADGLMPSYVTRLVRLAFLAPDITASILSGRHDPELTATRLMADTRFPLSWIDQRRALASA